VSISLPSREIYAVDVPEISDLTAEFRYNFFTPDESVDDSGTVIQSLVRPGGERDSDFVQFAATRAPRFVKLSFGPVRISSANREVTDLDVRANVFNAPRNEEVIFENLDKIVTEDDFASDNYASVSYEDGELQDKIHTLVSGTLDLMNEDDDADQDVSSYKSALRLSAQLPGYIKPQFLAKTMSSSEASGIKHFTASSNNVQSRHKQLQRQPAKMARTDIELTDRWWARMSTIKVTAQINTKLFHDVVRRQMVDPYSPYSDDLHGLHDYSKKVQEGARQRYSLQVTEADYKTFIPFVDLKIQNTANHTERSPAKVVGYIIDKTEVTPEGIVRDHDPIVMDNPDSGVTVDFQVRYNSTYRYTVRTIAMFTVPAIDDDTGDVASIKTLISSKPSNTVYVKTLETQAPPPPCDMDFTWDYERERMMLSWAFPPNSQRDIKKFQVFRRKAITDAFELVKQYDFDDSVVKFDDRETPDPLVTEILNSPATYYIDDEFNRQARYIYTLACIDAHGFTSNYSAQFELWFDVFKNRLERKLISHTGAPKAYPNLYLERDTFVDTIRTQGLKRMKLYFNPEYYHLLNDDDKVIRVLSTNQTGGGYYLQFINVDNQKSVALKIRIDDRIKAATKRLPFPKQSFGSKRQVRYERR
jgi:hypothetical protein